MASSYQPNHPMAPAIIPVVNVREPASLQVPVAKTATFNGTAVDRLVAGLEQCFATLHVGAVTGTLPTLDVVVQESPDNSTWTTIATFAQVTASNSLEIKKFTRTKRYIRIVATIAGTTPSFTMASILGY